MRSGRDQAGRQRTEVSAALVGVVLLAAVGWAAARQIKSPAQIAADTAPPDASLISVPVERRALATRGHRARHGALRRAAGGRAAGLGAEERHADRVARAARRQPAARRRGRADGLRPAGLRAARRDADAPRPRARRQRRGRAPARARAGAAGSRAGRRRRAATTAPRRPRSPSCIAATTPRRSASPRARPSGSAPPPARSPRRPTTSCRRASRCAAPAADVNQARLDAAAAAEAIPPARAAIYAARTRIAEGRDLLQIAKRQEKSGDATARRELAAAEVDVTAKQNALNEAIGARDDAQRDLNTLPDGRRDRARRGEHRAARRADGDQPARAPTSPPRSRRARRRQEGPQRVDPQGARRRAQGRRATSRSPAPTPSRARARSPRWGASTGSRSRACGSSARRRARRSRPTSSPPRCASCAASRASTRAWRRAAASRCPADEVLFFPQTPVRVDSVAARSGSQLNGDAHDGQQHAPGDRLVAVAAGEGPRAARRPGAHRGAGPAHHDQRTRRPGRRQAGHEPRTSIPAARTSR